MYRLKEIFLLLRFIVILCFFIIIGCAACGFTLKARGLNQREDFFYCRYFIRLNFGCAARKGGSHRSSSNFLHFPSSFSASVIKS